MVKAHVNLLDLAWQKGYKNEPKAALD